MKVYTSQYNYKGDNRLDITVKTGWNILAPTWDMVMNYKNGNISQEEYTKQYYNKMRTSYVNRKDDWNWILKQEEVVLVCFCKAGDFCHRLLLADILVKLGAEYLGEIK
jgi:uncharacterized protein YeaO (DUF488 family)